MAGTVILWGHALAALLFAVLALSQLRDGAVSVPRTAFVAALGITALWALAVAGIGNSDLTARVAESLRNIAWLAFMMALLRRDDSAGRDRAVTMIYGVVVLVALAGIVLSMIQASMTGDLVSSFAAVRILLRMMVALGALVLVHHLYSVAAPGARGGIRLAVAALAIMWTSDLVLYTTAYLNGDGSP